MAETFQEPSHRDADPALIKEDMEVLSDFELHRLSQQYSALQEYQLDTETLLDSGKLSLLAQLLNSQKEKVGGKQIPVMFRRPNYIFNNPSEYNESYLPVQRNALANYTILHTVNYRSKNILGFK